MAVGRDSPRFKAELDSGIYHIGSTRRARVESDVLEISSAFDALSAQKRTAVQIAIANGLGSGSIRYFQA